MAKVYDKFCLLIPAALFPYVIVGGVAVYCFSVMNTSAFSDAVMKYSYILWIAAVVWLVMSVVCNIFYIVLPKPTKPEKILKAALIIKCIHIPAYMVMYIYGLMLGMMFFMTLPMIIILFIIDSVILLLSNFISIYALAESIKGRIFRNNAIPIIAIVCQFFFCIDVISIFAVFFKAKRKPENILKTCVQQTE